MGIVAKKVAVKKSSSAGVAKVKTHTRKRKNGVAVVKQHTKKVVKARGADGKFSKPSPAKATPSKVAMPKKVTKGAKTTAAK